MPPVSPTYSHPGQAPPPHSIPPPPLHHQPPPTGPQSPQSLYNSTSPPPFAVRPDATAQYPSNSHQPYGDINGGPKSSPPRPQSESYGHGNGSNYRENAGHNHRRGGVRRGSFAGRKPPCFFFPTGRCKNGYVFFTFFNFIFLLLTRD
jgi:hypothetical protein